MFGLRLGFDDPRYLLLLPLVPLVIAIAYRRLAPLGRVRRWVAIGVRVSVMTGVILALAGVQLVWVTDRVTVVYLLDQSDSIPAPVRRQMLDFATAAARQHRDQAREDRVGMIVFGREAAVEIPPLDSDLPPLRRLDGNLGRTDATNLEAALKLAQATMPEDSRRRVVIISDGNETVGDARTAIARLSESGIGVDVLPVPLTATSEVVVEKIDLPTDVRQGQMIDARVVISNETAPGRTDPVTGRLSVTRDFGGQTELLLDQPIELLPGKNVLPLRHQINEAAPYTYEAKFIPDSAEDDAIPQNNTATGYSYARGQGRVLVIRPAGSSGSTTGADRMLAALRQAEIETVVQTTDSLFGSIAELQAYDAVILDGVPRTVGDAADSILGFTDEQIEILVRNTQQLGCGLLMTGGPEALGAGGWTGTKLEEAMPVDFQIKSLQVNSVGALQLVLDTSGSMQGENITLCKAAAIGAVRQLQPSDYIGVMTFDSVPHEIVPLQRVGKRTHIIPRISRITADGGTDLFPAMEKAFLSLRKADAATKHMIILTDGQTPPNRFQELTTRIREAGITVTGVAVGPYADVQLMSQIAAIGGGKVYHVTSPKAIPKILMREARRVSRGLIHEDSSGFAPEITYPHVVLSGLGSSPPPLTGFVMTTPKSNPLVQTVLTAPVPAGQINPLLSVWQYGLGRSAVLTTDSGERWATDWLAWPGYEKFFEQLVRWLMRPTGDTGNFSIATQVRDGEVQVIVTALDPSDEFLNFLSMNASVLDPDLKPIPLSIRQTAPGRYVGSFPADAAGNYFVNVLPQPGAAALTTGVTVPYSAEYRLRATDVGLLSTLAESRPKGGEPGQVLDPLSGDDLTAAAGRSDPFRGGLASARSIRDVWPWAVLAACWLFLADVFVRRVSIGMGWVSTAWGTLRGRRPDDNQVTLRLDSLHETKRRLADSIQRRQAESRYEPSGDAARDPQRPAAASSSNSVTEPTHKAFGPPTANGSSSASTGGIASQSEDRLSYTERLLEAKRRGKRPK